MKSHIATILASAAIVVGGGSALAHADARLLDHRHAVLPKTACTTADHNSAGSVDCFWDAGRWEPGMSEDAKHSSWVLLVRDGRGMVVKVRFLDPTYNKAHKSDTIVGS